MTFLALDFSRMKPVHGGAHRGLLTGVPNFVGGRRDGQIAEAGWQPFHRTEQGLSVDDGQQPPDSHYTLFVVDGGYLYHYIHNALLPPDYDDPSVAG